MPRLLRALRARPHVPLTGARTAAWAAELAGTAMLVAVIVGAAALTLGAGSPVAELLPGRGAGFLALGAIVSPSVALIAVSPLGRLSGAHLNPAVTLGFWACGRMGHRDLAGYLAAQAAGGCVGAAVALAALPAPLAESVGGAVTHPAVPVAAAVALEAAMTGALMAVLLGFTSSRRLMRWTPLAVVPALTAIIWLGSPPTGASLNPARSAGPAIAFGDLSDLWIYLLAPAAGALLAAAAWRVLPGASSTGMHGVMPRPPAERA